MFLSDEKVRKTFIITTTVIITTTTVFLFLYFFTDLCFSPPKDLSSNSLPNDWATFRYDLNNSGSLPSPANPTGKVKWIFSTGSAIHSSPSISRNSVYLGSRDSKLYSINKETGRKLILLFWLF